jgi:hypothetical protein
LTNTYTVNGFALVAPLLSITIRLNANNVSCGTTGAIKLGVGVLAPTSGMMGIPGAGICAQWYAAIYPL